MTQSWENPRYIFWNKSSLRIVTWCLRTYFVIKPEISHKTYTLKNYIGLSLTLCGSQPSEIDISQQVWFFLTQDRALGWVEWDLNAFSVWERSPGTVQKGPWSHAVCFSMDCSGSQETHWWGFQTAVHADRTSLREGTCLFRIYAELFRNLTYATTNLGAHWHRRVKICREQTHIRTHTEAGTTFSNQIILSPDSLKLFKGTVSSQDQQIWNIFWISRQMNFQDMTSQKVFQKLSKQMISFFLAIISLKHLDQFPSSLPKNLSRNKIMPVKL